MKVNKGKPLKWNQEFGQWEASCPTTPYQLQIQQEETDLATGYYFPDAAGGRKAFPPPLAIAQPMRDSCNSANEKPLYFQLAVYSNGLFVYNSLPNIPPSSIKERAPVLFCGLAYGFGIVGLFQIAILCSSQIKPSFTGKIIGSFIFKING